MPEEPLPADLGEQLTGGNVSRVWRVGETVRKPRAPWDGAVQALLRHLEAAGFEQAPRALGADAHGRSIVSLIAGQACQYPMPAFVWEDRMLVEMARLVRAYHDATADFVAPPDAVWQGATDAAGAAEVICHNDLAPYNTIFQRRRPVALIDFDMAAPGSRVWDVAYAVYRFVPLSAPEDVADRATPSFVREQGRRVGLFLRAYEAAFSAEQLLSTVVARLAALRGFMHARAAAGDASFARHIEAGDADLYRRDAEHVETRRAELLDGIAG